MTNILMGTAEYLIFHVFLEYFLILLKVSNGKMVKIKLPQDLQALPIWLKIHVLQNQAG